MKNYPIIDGHRQHFIFYPVMGKDNKWRAAEVLEDGYINPENNPIKVQFNSFEECKKGCDIHNNYHGWGEATVNKFISKNLNIMIIKEYHKGHLITKTSGYYWALSTPFKTMKSAKNFIDKQND